ncbi:rhombosortase [Oxalobacteraceae bacterium R-40]|uniref:Rhombosortase n=1 Tax=Keguizhuia sedimenti TaxID=3064264 RepID=A0ABU1BJ78_9BURK|nr:rhombosortase [Oxalobacteraceae bacterium R-40]
MNSHVAPGQAQADAHGRVPAKWRLCLGLAFVALVATYWSHGLESLRLDRDLAFSGQAWRLLTGHLVHLNMPHLVLNLLALLLLCELLWRDLHWRHGVGLLMFSALGVSAALLAWHPDIAWYTGLSGILHGLWAGCALYGLVVATSAPHTSVRKENQRQLRWTMHRRICAIAIALLGLKLASEFYFGPSQRTEQAIGGTVIAVSHAYGAVSGIIYLLIWQAAKYVRRAALPRFRLK